VKKEHHLDSLFRWMDHALWIGVGLSVIYWIIESAFDAFFLRRGDLIGQIFSPALHEVWVRSITVFFLLAFSWLVQFLNRRQRKTEDALQESETLLQNIYDGIEDGITVLDRDFNVVRVNRELKEIHAERRPLVGQKCYRVYEGKEARCSDCPSLRALKTGQKSKTIKPDPYIPSRWVSISAYPLRNAEGEITGVIEHVQDITETKQTQMELEQRAAQLALLNDIGSKIAAILDLESIQQRAVELVHRQFGYHHTALFLVDREQGELVMKARAGNFADLFPLDHRLKLGQGMVGWVGSYGETLLANHVDEEPRYVNLYPDRITTQSELSVPVVVGQDVVGVLDIQSPEADAFDENDVLAMETLAAQIAVAIENARLYGEIQRELSERERAEEALAEKAEALIKSNKELQHFAYIVSHDLQEPLRMVRSYVQLLERRYAGELDEDADDFIHYAVDGATRMQQMIDDLLRYSRVSTHGEPFATTDCDDIIRDVLDNLQIAIEESGAEITTESLPTVIGDPAQLTRLLQNLVSNGIKFSQNGSPPRIHVSAEEESDAWRFAVADNGIGIPPQESERIFRIFQRLHTRDEYPGTGIGLAVCKQIVQRHGGRIWVDSSPGEGSTFYFTIPKSGGSQ